MKVTVTLADSVTEAPHLAAFKGWAVLQRNAVALLQFETTKRAQGKVDQLPCLVYGGRRNRHQRHRHGPYLARLLRPTHRLPHLSTLKKERGDTQGDQRTCHFHSAAIARASARDGTASVCRAGVRSLRPSKNTCHSPCSAAARCQQWAGGCATLRACLSSPGIVPCKTVKPKTHCAALAP